MNPPDEIPIFPVAHMPLAPVKDLGIIMMRLDYLSSPMQPINQPNIGTSYALTPGQAAELIAMLQKQLDYVGIGEPPAPQGQRH